MSTFLKKAAIAATVLAGVAGAAHAAEGYVGGALSAPDYRDTINGRGDGDGGRGPGLKVYGGYQLTPNFAVEAGLVNLGRSHDSPDGSAKAYGGYIDGVGSVSLAPKWSLLGSVGVAQLRVTTPGGNDTSPALKLGAGLQYEVSPTTSLTLGYDHYRLSDAFDSKPNIGQTVFGVKVGF